MKKLHRKRSLYFKLFFSSTIIVCVTFLFIIVLNRFFLNTYEEQIGKRNLTDLTNTAEMFDNILSETITISGQLSTDTVILEAINVGSDSMDPAQILNVRRRLNNVTSDYFDDIFLYFTSSGRVVSKTHACFFLPMYILSYYPNDYETFNLSNMSSPCVLKTVPMSNYQTMVVLQTIPIGNRKKTDVTCCFVFQRNILTEFWDKRTPEGGYLILADQNGDVVLSSGIPPFENVQDITRDESYYKASMNGKRYIVQTVNSNYQGYVYYSIASEEVYSKQINSMKRILTVSYAVYFMIAMLIVQWFSKRNSAPISQLVHELSEISINVPGNGDEIEYIRSVIRKTQSDKKQLNDVLASDILRRIIYGQTDLRSDCAAYFRKAGLEVISDVFSVILLKIEQYKGDELPNEFSEAALKKILSEISPSNVRIHMLAESSSLYICIVNHKMPGEVPPPALCEGFASFFSRNLHIQLTQSCSKEYMGLEGIKAAYDESRNAMEFRAVFGQGAVIESGSIARSAFRYSLSSRDVIEQTLLSCVFTGSPKADNAVARIHERCRLAQYCMPDEFKCYYFDMLDLMKCVAQKANADEEILKALSECDTLPDFDEVFISTLNRIHDMVASNDSNRHTSDTCEQVRDFIMENYTDPGLCVTSVGNHMNMSGQYLSRLFNEQFGETITAFIVSVRIEQSKKLLQETQLSVEKVSEKCGFLSSSTYIRLFKKIVGCTPGTFRSDGSYKQEEDGISKITNDI